MRNELFQQAKSFVQQAVMVTNGFEEGDQEQAILEGPKMLCLLRMPIRQMRNVNSFINFKINWINCNKKKAMANRHSLLFDFKLLNSLNLLEIFRFALKSYLHLVSSRLRDFLPLISEIIGFSRFKRQVLKSLCKHFVF